jgi:hypothetical protein
MPALTVRRPRSLAASYDPGIFGLPHQAFELSSDHRGQIQGGFEPSRPFISRSFRGLRAISILWKALASVRTSKKFCVGVRSPFLYDGSTVPGNAARFFGIYAYYLGVPSSPSMRRFSEQRTDALVGEAEIICWIAAYANEHAKAPPMDY